MTDDQSSKAGYRRALWTVAILNAGFGIIEMTGGFLSSSQSLKADALDFLGDGLITFIGIIAIARLPAVRARIALLQGVFLGALGLAVLTATVLRMMGAGRPQAEIMGILGAIGLIVNLAAAFVLIPHRSGDVNARAIWLFSRNDALGNIAVMASAGLVAVTGSRWPDLVVAIVIAVLFLHSSWAIVTKALEGIRVR